MLATMFTYPELAPSLISIFLGLGMGAYGLLKGIRDIRVGALPFTEFFCLLGGLLMVAAPAVIYLLRRWIDTWLDPEAIASGNPLMSADAVNTTVFWVCWILLWLVAAVTLPSPRAIVQEWKEERFMFAMGGRFPGSKNRPEA